MKQPMRRNPAGRRRRWARAAAAIGILGAVAAAHTAAIASAKAKPHYPRGTVHLPSSQIKAVNGVVCGNLSGTWVPGTVFSSHWFISDTWQYTNSLSLARHAHRSVRQQALKLARYYARRAKAHQPICSALAKPLGKATPSPSPAGGALASLGQEPNPSIFGIDTGTFDSSQANFVNDFPTAQSLGARWDRVTLGPKTATGSYAAVDYEVTQARQHGMGVILSFGGIASACSISPPPSNVGGCAPTSTQDLSTYQSYVTQILTHYRNVVDYYESWIEPNHGSQWNGTANPSQYAALLKAEYSAFQSFNAQNGTHMKLLFGSSNGFTIDPSSDSNDVAVLSFTHQVLDALGGQRPFDGAALHAYRYPPAGTAADGVPAGGPADLDYDYVGNLTYPSQGCAATSGGWCRMTWPQELSAFEQEFINHGYGQVPVWLTEFGWPGNGPSSNCSQLENQPGYCPDYTTQDGDLKAAYADLLELPFIQGALWFNLRDYQPSIQSPDPPFFYHYGLLNYDYSHKSAADDFKALAAAHPNQ